MSEKRWPCIHGSECDGRGLHCGPDQSRKKSTPKPASEMAAIRARAWETRRAKYGQQGHRGSYAR
jgi:hypothetical protein